MNWRIVSSPALFAVALIVLTAATLAPQTAISQTPNETQSLNKQFDEEIYDLFEKNCLSCHSGEKPAAGMDLGDFATAADVAANPKKFDKVIQNIRSQVMPPAEGGNPSLADREQMVQWLTRALATQEKLINPTIRRLNRTEYNHVIQDLLFIEGNFSRDFPSDDVGYGFDNIGDVLTLTPLHLEMYLKAAQAVTDQAIFIPQPKIRTVDIEKGTLPENSAMSGEGFLNMYANGVFSTTFQEVESGDYEIELELAATATGVGPADAQLRINNQNFQLLNVKTLSPTLFKIPVRLTTRSVKLDVAFTNDYYQPNSPDPANRDRNLHIYSITLRGPDGTTTGLPDSHRRLIFASPSGTKNHLTAAREVLEKFATRAYRRPITPEESNRIMSIYQLVRKNNDSYEQGIRTAIQAILVNPNFLFRIEPAGKSRDLNGYELASRLSFFLWNSIPDQTLYDLAASGGLTKPKILEAQVQRMLADPKAERFSADFSTQWLQIRRLDEHDADPELFPTFNQQLKDDLSQEVNLYFRDMLVLDRPITEFINGKFTFLNHRLAKHYGIAGDFDQNFRRVDVSTQNRGGLLGMGAILSVTSNPNRTSPVKRGKFIMEQILGTPPPPPPPNVGVLDDTKEAITATRMRERLAQHRADPSCASCHRPLDAYGFTLENFDAVGGFRTKDGTFPVDNIGELPGKITLNGLADLRKNLASREVDFTRTLTEKLMTYALGRGLTASDHVQISNLAQRQKNPTLQRLITEIILSDAFRKRTNN